MIVRYVMEAFGSVFGWLVGLMPDAGTSLIMPGYTPIMNALADVNAVLPIVGPIKAALGIVTAMGLFLLFKILEWGWKMLPLT